MVKHIVFFRLTSFDSDAEKESQIEKMKKIFSALPSKLHFIGSYMTGKNISTGDHAWDFVIDSAFSSRQDLERYIESPEHREAVRKASVIKKEKAVVDYEY
ncbi:MAG TPA: Dabb family protein [Bacteroidales bacterium]|nr:Dabb family protein [Bacteroidales bacterium]